MEQGAESVTAVTGQRSSNSSITVRAGDEVTLSCTQVIDGQHECDRTDWYFSGSRNTKLVARGRIVVEDKSTSDRLRVTETCALVLKKVSAGDAGRFECQQITVTGQRSSNSSITVRAGDNVTLSCTEAIGGEYECNNTDWYFIGSENIKLVGVGKIVVKDKSTSDRLRVTETCALVLKKVSAGDTGRFDCQQFSSGKIHHTTHVNLSVVSMTEQKIDEDVTLNCSVSSYGDCRDKVRWLYRGNPVDKGHGELKTSQSGCSATVSFLKTHFISNVLDNFKCEVMNSSSENKQQFTFSPRSSGNPVDKGHGELKTSQSGCSATVSFSKTHFSSNDLDNFKCEVMNSSSGNKQQFTFSPRSSGKRGSSSGDKETPDKPTGTSVVPLNNVSVTVGGEPQDQHVDSTGE
ncbi:hypothetical protein INR49_008193 [Caranx melampygus]|nr:hypothetical protein INR49_008193 [Caranx melampygus]